MQPYKTVFIVDTCVLYWRPGTIIPNERRPDYLPTKRKGVLVVIPEMVLHELRHLRNNSKKHKATPYQNYQKRVARLLLQAIFKGFKDYACSTDLTRTSSLGFRNRCFSLVKPTRKFLNSMPTKLRKHDDVVLATALYCAMLKAGVNPVIYDQNFNFGSVDATLVTADKQLAGDARREGLRVMLLQDSSNGLSRKGKKPSDGSSKKIKKQKPRRRPAKHRRYHHASYGGGASYDGDTHYVPDRCGYL